MASKTTRWIRDHLATAPAIYGLIVYVVLIISTSDDEPEAIFVLLWSAIALVVFYLAHSFAEALAAHDQPSLRAAARRGLSHSSGMLYAAILPSLALVVCAIVGVPGEDASNWSLGVGVIVLGYLGYQASADRGSKIGVRILSALLTAFLGFIIMFIDYMVH